MIAVVYFAYIILVLDILVKKFTNQVTTQIISL